MREDQETVDLVLRVVNETQLAWLLTDSDDDGDAVWVPKSQVEQGAQVGTSDTFEFTVPVWLAKREGLV